MVVQSICQWADKDQDLYIRKGIREQDFVWKMNLPKYAVVKNTTFKDGLLSITVKVEVPEEQQRKLIEIK